MWKKARVESEAKIHAGINNVFISQIGIDLYSVSCGNHNHTLLQSLMRDMASPRALGWSTSVEPAFACSVAHKYIRYQYYGLEKSA